MGYKQAGARALIGRTINQVSVTLSPLSSSSINSVQILCKAQFLASQDAPEVVLAQSVWLQIETFL